MTNARRKGSRILKCQYGSARKSAISLLTAKFVSAYTPANLTMMLPGRASSRSYACRGRTPFAREAAMENVKE